MNKPLEQMTIEELIKFVAEKNIQHGHEERQIEQAEKILNARLLEQVNGGLVSVGTRLEGLGAGLSQLNQSLRDGIHSNEVLALANTKYTKIMASLTLALVIATFALAGVGWRQMVLLDIYTRETQNLSRTASEQLVQSRLDSALSHRPYVEIRPANFFVTGMKDPKDETSVFCYLTLEMKNYGPIPAAEVTITDFRLGSKSRGYLTPENFRIAVSDITLFPGSSARVEISFVMNPDYHIKLYNDGMENYEIYLELNYTTAKELGGKLKHWYKCNWFYSNRRFTIQNSETDLVRP